MLFACACSRDSCLLCVLIVHVHAAAEDVIGAFFNRSWSAAPAAREHDATGAKPGWRAVLQVSLTVSAGCDVDTTASNAPLYAAAAPREVPGAWPIRPEAGAGLGPGLGSSPAARHPTRPIWAGGFFGRVRAPAHRFRAAAGALTPGVASLRPLSPRCPSDTRPSPAQGDWATAQRARGLCRACAAGEAATVGPADADLPVKGAPPAAPSAVPAPGVSLGAAAARARVLAGILAGTLRRALGMSARLLATARVLSGFAAWPLWAAAAVYAPVGCQRSLVAPVSSSGPFGRSPWEAADASAAQHARRGVFWMHRLPMYRGRLLATLAAAVHTGGNDLFESLPGPAPTSEAEPLPFEARGTHSTATLARAKDATAGALCWALHPAVRAGSLRPGAAAGRAAVRAALRTRPPAHTLQPGLPTVLPRAGWLRDMHGVLVA